MTTDEETGMQLLERCWLLYWKCCWRAASRVNAAQRESLVDELMGEVVDRVPRIRAAWDESRGVPLRPYVLISLRWYLHKYVARWRQLRGRYAQLSAAGHVESGRAGRCASLACGRHETARRQRGASEEMERLLSLLPSDSRRAVELMELDGAPADEAACEIGCSTREVRRLRREALITLREMGRA